MPNCSWAVISVHYELPVPSLTFDVALEDGAKILVRRHGRPDGVRLFLSHGNGFAADAYFPYWQYLLAKFDLVVFDFRNHGQNVPVVPPHHTYEQLTRDLERVIQAVKVRLGQRATAGLFHSMSTRTAMKHAIDIGWRWDALILFDPPNVPPPDHPLYPAMAAFEKRLIDCALHRRRRFAVVDATGSRLVCASLKRQAQTEIRSGGPCPLWVKSRHVRNRDVRFTPESGHSVMR
jgi:pimeloyl-ACP methyl ester carboxylesterase